ncbi:hypothetical protein SADUNF_Sadunf11G0083900 [Salix dunnii]|uniref:Uncharacterized protein n=1 Tax=Salix dunnii TaxID=1413687 RepID=A0A835JQQ1_9ROSI|nr:hypothetical protein SADUNF_Sadunf11G0083900 [Salix dunnii]
MIVGSSFTEDLYKIFSGLVMPIPLQMLSNAVREKLPCFKNLPNFQNLTRLEIEASGDYYWFISQEILKCSPKLEVLMLYKDKTLTVQTKEPPKWPSLLHVNTSVIPKWQNPEFVPQHAVKP